MEERDSFKSRLGFILVSAGCAIGIGNVWKFPYITGEYGGAVFVLFYLAFLILLGIPVVTMELAVGRSSRKSVLRGFETLEPKGTYWHLHGWVCLIGSYILMVYYTTISGWMVDYFWKFLSGSFVEASPGRVADIFGQMVSSPMELMFFMGLTVLVGFAVCAGGVQGSLEKVTKFMMLGLLGLIILLAVNSVMIPGGEKGIAFYLLPDWGRAVEAGLIIFPACFAYGVEPDQGPSLIFVTLPNIFINMPMGQIWGGLFFVFMTFASFSTVTAVFEALIGNCMDNFGWGRKKAVYILLPLVFFGSIPCVLGFNMWSDVQILGSKGILDTEDFIVSNLVLPIGSLIFALFCVSKYGWGFDHYLKEVNTGDGMKIPRWLKSYFQIVLPLLITVIAARSLIG
jgi:transporter